MKRPILVAALTLMVLAALPLPASAQTSALNNAVRKYNDAQYAEAAFGFYEVAAYDTILENRFKAEYYLAQSLRKMGMARASAFFYQTVMTQGPNHPYYLKSVEELVQIAEEIKDDAFLPRLIEREYNAAFAQLPPETLYKINYLVGLQNFRRERVTEAAQFLGAVPRESSYYAKAQFLLAIVDTFQSREGGTRALERYQDILTLKNSGELAYWDLDNAQQLAVLGLARTYYTLGRYAESKAWYDRIPRYSTYWDVSLFENGWAAYMADDIGSAMGSIHSLHAPQFAGSFQPEALILKATVYHSACLYEEVKKELATFDGHYKPMAEKVDALLKAHPGDDELPLFLRMLTAPEGSAERLPRAVRNLLLDNQRIQNLVSYIQLLEQEAARTNQESIWKGSNLQKEILDSLQQQREQNMLATGGFIRSRLAKLVADVSNYDGQAEILRFETSKKEKEMLEAGVDPMTRLKGQALLRPVMPGDDWQYWSFDGEWWVDELGFYKYTLKSACEAEAGAAGGLQ